VLAVDLLPPAAEAGRGPALVQVLGERAQDRRGPAVVAHRENLPSGSTLPTVEQ
jgi:hypothetical protein